MAQEAYIIDIVRTPVGKYGGSLSTVRPDDLVAHVIKELMARNAEVNPEEVEEVILGAANQAGEDNRNVARMAALLAGLPAEVGGVTVNRLCASGLQSIADAARAIKAGEGDVFIAGGVESMTRAPFVMAKSESAWGRTPEIYDTTIGWRFTNPVLSKLYHPFAMGETAENVAKKWNISREAQDAFAHQSQTRYQAAAQAGKFQDEIVPVPVPQKKGEPIMFDSDEHPRLSPIEKLAELKPAFTKENGTVTAGNSSGINDGAAAALIVSGDFLRKHNLKPMARIVASAVAGVDPGCMGIGACAGYAKGAAACGAGSKRP